MFLKKSKVFFIRTQNAEAREAVALKTQRLLSESGLLSFIKQDDRTVLKMHFGEEGNTGFVRPEYVRVICDAVAQRGGVPFLADTNTLYRGRRMNSLEHLKLARDHGFTSDALAAEVMISDDSKQENCLELKIRAKFIRKAKIARIFHDADGFISAAHFKGHLLTGFGGALKNIGMGCATREGKLAQHSDFSPFVRLDNCTGCGACEKACPVDAIKIENKKSHIDQSLCIGCASCIAACKYEAIDVDWWKGHAIIQEKMAEYAKAALDGKKGRAAFVNFAIKITSDCDCMAKDEPAIAPDVGILISSDPVSADKAAFDLVSAAAGKDVFKEAHPKIDSFKQLVHAEKIGLGSMKYELIEI